MGEAKRRKQAGAVPLSTEAYRIHRHKAADQKIEVALLDALEEASHRKLFYRPNNLDALLRMAEPFVDKDILRALILKDGDLPPGKGLGFAVIPANDAIDDQWYLRHLKEPPAVVFIAAVGPDRYAAFGNGGSEGLAEGLAAERGRLVGLGAWLLPAGVAREEIESADVIIGVDSRTGEETIFYGMSLLKRIAAGLKGKRLRCGVLRVPLDWSGDDPALLAAACMSWKGGCDVATDRGAA